MELVKDVLIFKLLTGIKMGNYVLLLNVIQIKFYSRLEIAKLVDKILNQMILSVHVFLQHHQHQVQDVIILRPGIL